MARTKAEAKKRTVATTVVTKGGEQVVVRKKHRYRPGTRATLEIKKYMHGKRATAKCIPKTRIEKLIREIQQDLGYRADRFTKKAIEALWEGIHVIY